MTAGNETPQLAILDIIKVMEKIPHRYPMLLVDRVKDIVPNLSAVGIKNVTINEPFFQGHFPSRPIMPGVLIVEAMAQTAAVLVVHSLGAEAEGKLVYFMSINEARFRRPVEPGDTLHIHVTCQQSRRNVSRFGAVAKVNDIPVAEATFTAMISDN